MGNQLIAKRLPDAAFKKALRLWPDIPNDAKRRVVFTTDPHRLERELQKRG